MSDDASRKDAETPRKENKQLLVSLRLGDFARGSFVNVEIRPAKSALEIWC
jgi:hypothetical protein